MKRLRREEAKRQVWSHGCNQWLIPINRKNTLCPIFWDKTDNGDL